MTQNKGAEVGTAVGMEVEPVIKVHLKTWIVVACAALVYFCTMLSIIGSGFLAQPIVAIVGGASESAWFSQSLNILGIAVTLPISQIADYWGRKWILLFLVLAGCVGAIIISRANNIQTVIAGFILLGINYGCQPILFTMVSEILPRKHRPWAQAIINGAAGVAGVLGLLMGGGLLEYGNLENYRIYFYILAGLFGTAFTGLFFFYNPPPRKLQDSLTFLEKARKLDWVGYALFAPGLTLFSVALSWSKNPYSWSNVRIYLPFVLGVIVMIAFSLYEWRVKKDGVIHHDLFHNRNFVVALVAVLVDGISFFTTNYFFAVQYGLFTGSDTLMTAAAFSMLFVAGVGASIVFGLIATKFKILRVPGMIGLSVIVLFNILMATTTTSTAASIYWGYAVFAGIGVGSVIPPFMVAAQLSTPPDLISLASGVTCVCRPIGGVIGLAVNNAIFNGVLSTQTPAKISAATMRLGFPASSVGPLVEALTAKNEAALAKIPGATEAIIAAAGDALLEAYAVAFRDCWIMAACLCVPAVIVAFFIRDPRSEFKAHIDAPVEIKVLEEQERVEAGYKGHGSSLSMKQEIEICE